MLRRICLVVDDDPAIRTFVKAILQREEFETVEADGGNAALEVASRLNGSLALVVSDIQMPDGDGLSLAYRLRDRFPAVPVVLTSGYGRPEADFEFLEKPFSWTALAGVVRRVALSDVP